ncbi:hypothetical protein GW17_00035453 [Ensete ventricosum]|nr:hypothetical protein GW17_00035453 [Ensete ventricosum]
MRSAQRLGWLCSSYGSTLATKLDGAQGKRGAWSKMRPCKVGGVRQLPKELCKAHKVGTALVKSRNLASAFAGAEQGTCCSARRSSPKGMVVSETSNGKNVKRKVAPTGQISRGDKS